MAKWYTVGKVLKKKAPKTGNQVVLGGDNFHKLTVTLTVTNEKGEVVASAVNPFLQIRDPRTNPNLKEGTKIPDFIRQELQLVVDE